MLAFFVSFALHLVHRRKIRPLPAIPSKIALPLLMFLFGAFVSALSGIAAHPERAQMILGAFKGFVLEPVLFILAMTMIIAGDDDPEKAKALFLRAYLLSALIVAGVALLLALLVPGIAVTYDGRLRGFFSSPNQLAMYLQPAILLALAPRSESSVHQKRGRLFCSLLFSSALFGTMLWTKSAGAIVGLSVGGAMCLAFWRRKRTLLFAIRLGLLLALLLGFLLPFLAVRFSPLFLSEGERSSLASRVMIWRTATDLLRSQWLFGIGPGAFEAEYLAAQPKYPPYLEWAVPQPHNLFLAFWLETGILGLGAFLWLIAQSIWRMTLIAADDGSAAIRSVSFAAQGALVALLVHGFVDTPYWKNDLAVVFLLLVVTMFVETEKRGEKFVRTFLSEHYNRHR
jgi:O-antigen ligase